MKVETADYLAKARATLADAQKIASLPLPHVAAREAYLAVFHAAEAYIFEQTGKVQDASRRAQRICPAGKSRAAHRARTHHLPRHRLSIQDTGRLRRRCNRRADYARRGDRCHCDDDALHRHYNPSAAAGPDAAAWTARTAISAESKCPFRIGPSTGEPALQQDT
jgi:hypothetical protein